MQLRGYVNEIIYRNVDNGYCVVNVSTLSGYWTCVGPFPLVMEGEDVIMDGDWVLNPNFGKQFSVKTAQIQLPTTEIAIQKYLSSGFFKGIGPDTARKIVERFKDKTFEVIETNPRLVATIKGISYLKALNLCEEYIEHMEMQATIIYLQSYDISVSLAIKVFKVYGKDTQRKIEENPYQMVRDIEGVGFITADAIAQKIGIAPDSDYRIYAAISYVLVEASRKNGHTFLLYNVVLNGVLNLLKLDEQLYVDKVETLICKSEENREIVILEQEETKIIMSMSCYRAEKFIAQKLISLQNETSKDIVADVDLDIKTYQNVNNIELDIKQIEAIKNSITYGVNVITGGPGTGKTTIIKAIIGIFASLGMSFCLCAPTGRAAKRLTESTGYEAKTIHRMLGLSFNTGAAAFEFNIDNRMAADVVIIDEVSMCDIFIFNALLSALKKGARLVMVGDKDQLPSVGAGNVLLDIIKSQAIPVSYLTHIFRQGENSMIVYNAHEINCGKMPQIDNSKYKDFFFQQEETPQDILKTVVEMATIRLPKYFNVGVGDIQILCPIKKGIAGVDNLNVEMQKALNPRLLGVQEISSGGNIFRVNDRVIHTENNYQLKWTSDVDSSSGTGIFNGDMGYIVDINSHKPTLTVRFDDGKVALYSQGEFSQLSLAYAISIHKSQGSEFKVAIIAIQPSSPFVMTRNLIYTGITRAKTGVVIVGTKNTLMKMVSNNNIAKRNSKLVEFIRQEAELNLM